MWRAFVKSVDVHGEKLYVAVSFVNGDNETSHVFVYSLSGSFTLVDIKNDVTQYLQRLNVAATRIDALRGLVGKEVF